MVHRFILEPYKGQKTRYTCPQCKKEKQFTRYIDLQTNTHLSDLVGKCNRESKCGYHLTPKKYFLSNPDYKPEQWRSSDEWKKKLKPEIQEYSYLGLSLVTKSLRRYSDNNFTQFLENIFLQDVAKALIERFQIGTSKRWPGATVFWQIDAAHKVRTGKVMLYNRITGKRIKEPLRIDWVHSILIRKKALKSFQLKQCLFGEHQLLFDSNSKPIGIVESEKTAIIMTAIFPKYIWMASGSLTNIRLDLFKKLEGRDIVFFPDLGGFEKWKSKAEELTIHGFNVTVSEVLEEKAVLDDKQYGFDIADFFLKHRDPQTGILLKDGVFPFSWEIDLEAIEMPCKIQTN